MPNFRKGAVTYVADPDQGLVPSPRWYEHLRDLGVDAVKVRVAADRRNSIPVGLYTRALAGYRASGIHVTLLIDLDFNRPWTEPTQRALYPNAELGYGGNKRLNRFIKDSCVRAHWLARAFAPYATDWILGNERNLRGLLAVGQTAPPVPGDLKSSAWSPEVSFSYDHEVAGWLRSGGATTVCLGALSFLPTSGVDGANPYLGGFIRKGLGYLASTKAGPLPIDAIAVNAEGWWTPAQAAAMKRCLDSAFGHDYPLWVTEWGQKNPALAGHEDKARETNAALDAVAARKYFFSDNASDPNNPNVFGLTLWTVERGMFWPTSPLPWQPVFASL